MTFSTRTVFRICIVIYILLVVSAVAVGFYLPDPAVRDVNHYIFFEHIAQGPEQLNLSVVLYLNTGLLLWRRRCE